MESRMRTRKLLAQLISVRLYLCFALSIFALRRIVSRRSTTDCQWRSAPFSSIPGARHRALPQGTLRRSEAHAVASGGTRTHVYRPKRLTEWKSLLQYKLPYALLNATLVMLLFCFCIAFASSPLPLPLPCPRSTQ